MNSHNNYVLPIFSNVISPLYPICIGELMNAAWYKWITLSAVWFSCPFLVTVPCTFDTTEMHTKKGKKRSRHVRFIPYEMKIETSWSIHHINVCKPKVT